jgi:hypothetical protein
MFAEPGTPFATIKSDLLKVLHERYPDGIPNSDSGDIAAVPKDVTDVILGVPNDVYDASKGWSELDTDAGGGIKETPESMGLKNGSMLAFSFVPASDEEKQPEFYVEFSNVDELYPDEE